MMRMRNGGFGTSPYTRPAGFNPFQLPQKFLPVLIAQVVALLVILNIWLSWNGGFIPWFLVGSPEAMSTSNTGLAAFFAYPSNDGKLITWAHAVNNKQSLHESLQTNVNCLEADVILRNQGTRKQELVPIMGHPPEIDGDLTLVDFIELSASSKKALKLDFKSIEAVELSLQLLHERKSKLQQPILLNADVLQGPGGSETVVQGSSFLNKVKSGFPDCTLSLGWSTCNMYKLDHDKAYSWEHVKAMKDLLEKQGVKQSVTFPVRASMLKGSVITLKWLCEQFDASLTVFVSDPKEAVSFSELVYLRSKMPKEKVYYDMPSDLMAKLHSQVDDTTLLTQDHQDRERHTFKSSNWIIKVTDDNSDMIVSEDVVWMSGVDALLMSSHRPHLGQNVVIEGAVSFVAKSDEPSVKTSLQIYMFTSDSMNSHMSGIRCSININGKMTISSDHLQLEEEDFYHDGTVEPSINNCYQFHILVNKDMITFTVQTVGKNCSVYKGIDSNKYQQSKISADLPMKKLPKEAYSVSIRASDSKAFAILEQISIHEPSSN